MDINRADLLLLKTRLRGVQFRKFIDAKGLSKYRIAKDCNITYRTLLNWEQKKAIPSDDNAIVVGRYLGLLKPDEATYLELKKEQEELRKKIDRLVRGE